MNFKRWVIATFNFFKNYYSDYEDAYDQGYDDGFSEGFDEGCMTGKTAGQVLWSDMFSFLKERNLIDNHEEVSTMDIMERLLEYERDLKNARNPVDV